LVRLKKEDKREYSKKDKKAKGGEKMKKSIFITFFSLSILLCFLYGFQRQQETIEPLEHEVTVELVVVEVFVTDKEGNFIDSLTKNDFEIFEDGKRVEIQYFAVVSPEKEFLVEEIPEEVQEAKIPIVPQKMKLVILFDNLNTYRFFLISQWPQIVEMFKALSGKVEETMVIELNREYGMRIIQPFTSDQSLLAEKISEFEVDIWREFEEHYLRSQMETLEKERRLSLMDRFIGHPEYLMYAFGQEARYLRRLRLGDSFSAFLAAVNYIRRFEGVKSVLMVSDGFHLEERGTGVVRIFDPFKVFGGKKIFEQREAFDEFIKLINEERLIFYAVSPKGLREFFSVNAPGYIPGRGVFSDEMEQWKKEIYSLQEIADKTGGLYLAGQKKFEDFIKEMGRDLTHFYDISYSPLKKRKKGYHKIEVRVKKPGLKVRHKKSYSDFTEAELEKKNLASAFLSPSFFKDIAFSCKTDFIALKGGYPQFWIRLDIPLDQFKKNQYVTPPDETALLFGINEWSENRVHTGGRMVGIKKAVEEDIDSLYRAFITSIVKIKPGDYETRIILRESGDRIGGWEDTIKIPNIKKWRSLSLINSIFGFVKEMEEENINRFSFSIGDGSLLLSRYKLYPFVENVFKIESETAIFLQIYNPEKLRDVILQYSLIGEENTTLNLSSEKIESHFDKDSKILNEVYLLDFQKIPPADYQLKIESSDGQIEKTVEIKVVS